jgi:hypothetical protein
MVVVNQLIIIVTQFYGIVTLSWKAVRVGGRGGVMIIDTFEDVIPIAGKPCEPNILIMRLTSYFPQQIPKLQFKS